MSGAVVLISCALVAQSGTSGNRYGNPASQRAPSAESSSLSFGGTTSSTPAASGMTAVQPTRERAAAPNAASRSVVGQAPGARAASRSANHTRLAQSPYGANTTATAGASAASGERAAKPSELMRAMLSPPRGSRLAGSPVRLAQVVQAASSRREQSQCIDAYWDLCAATADYYLGLHEQNELGRYRSAVPRVGEAWKVAEAEMGVRIGTSLRAARAAQYRLASLMGQNGAYLPSDVPHCAGYNARYSELFAQRQSPEARELDQLLPLRYAELKSAATAVIEAESWLQLVGSQLKQDSDGTGVVKALGLFALRRRAFVQIAKDYNRRIARYTELATPGQVGSDRLVAMLINDGRRSNTASRNARPGRRPATQGNRPAAGSTNPPTTYSNPAPAGDRQASAPDAENQSTGIQTVSAELTLPATTRRADSASPRPPLSESDWRTPANDLPRPPSAQTEPQQSPSAERSVLVQPR